MWREVNEETGLGPGDVTLVGEHPDWVPYEWPLEVRAGRKGIGQVQRWFTFRVVDEARRAAAGRLRVHGVAVGRPPVADRQRRCLPGAGLRAGAAASEPGQTLFDDAAAERLRRQAPLAARLRPRTIDDVVGQPHLLGPGKPLRRLVETDTMSSVLLWGPPGTGKTTLALAVAGTTAKEFEQLSAVTAGVKDVRDVIERARRRLGEHDRGTILFLDEIHRFNKAQQDALLPAVEDGTLTLIGATTENPFFEVNPPLRSRSTLFRLEPLDHDSLRTLARARPRRPAGVGGPRGDRPDRRAGRRRRPPGADLGRGRRRPRPPRPGRR